MADTKEQRAAKQALGFTRKPDLPVCGVCAKQAEKTIDGPYGKYEVKWCQLGDFQVTKWNSCLSFEPKEN